jgi:phosphoglycerate kinase
MKTVRKIADVADLKGRYVIVRAALNVPMADGKVANQFRIIRALPTIEHLVAAGARVILMGHIGREPHETLLPVYEILKEHFTITWSPELTGPGVMEKRNALQDGEVLMLENVRQHPGETENDAALASEWASLGELYVADAFADAHRAHASVVGIPSHLPSYAGINFSLEYEELKRSMTPTAPSLFILGGAKFETKTPLVEKFLGTYDHIFIGGALAHDFFVARGLSVGKSLVSDIDLSQFAFVNDPRILLPIDVVVATGNVTRTTTPDDVHEDEVIVDAGPETIAMLSLYTRGAQSILWNGPLGNYEHGHEAATVALARLIAESSAYTVVGGGDTVASIEALGLSGKFGFMSTAGGAMLEFLEHGTIVGVDALVDSPEGK